MTFSERMRQVSTPEDLGRLMIEVRKKGSDGWTLSTARDRVPEHLWPVLEEHFGDDGLILEWTEEGARELSSGSAVRTSILATIRQLNADLRAAREIAGAEQHDQLETRNASTQAAAPNPALEDFESELVEVQGIVPSGEREREEAASASGVIGVEPEGASPSAADRDFSEEPTDQRPVPAVAKQVSVAYASHTFEKGWCTRCGIHDEVARENDWTCDPAEPTTPPPAEAAARASRPTSSHSFEGNWCIRCGLSRDQASRFVCK